MSPAAATDLAIGLMASHKLLPLWRFEIDHARKRAGVCRHGPKVISLSKHYIEHNEVVDIRDTILHEIAHALAGPGHGHDKYWMEVCVRIGARPVRCYDSSKIVMPKGNIQVTCQGCNLVFYRHRQKKGNFYHAACGPTKGQLTYVRTSS